MRALVFGAPPSSDEVRPRPVDPLDERLLAQPFGLHEVDDVSTPQPDWVVVRPLLAGVCGSDSKLLLGDFGEGDLDNPMAGFSSLPYVPGHEAIGVVCELGPEARGVEVGQRVVLNPWLSCAPRGLPAHCPACRTGDLNLCWNFTEGWFRPGVHIGVTSDVPGAWADRFTAHDSMLFRVPDAIPDDIAVLADPFAVSMHAVVRNPPPDGGRVLVHGAGTLGLTTVAALRALHPSCEVGVVARFPCQRATAHRLGADCIFEHHPAEQLVEELAAWSGGVLHSGLAGLPMAHPAGIDVVYDTVARPETLEVGVRVLRARGTLVLTGVHTPGRWEHTPAYFKELVLAGSSGFGIEVVNGARKHALLHYFDLVLAGSVDLSGMVTHRYRLSQWWPALQALARPASSQAIKVVFFP